MVKILKYIDTLEKEIQWGLLGKYQLRLNLNLNIREFWKAHQQNNQCFI